MISIVIPSYNRKDCVLALLHDVYRQGGVEFEVIVVDDCSPDGSYEAIAAEFPQVTLLKNEKNGGPCVTRNKGVLAAKGEFIVGFDSDVTVPDTRLLQKVEQAFAEMPQATGLAFRLFKPDGVTDDVERWWHPLPIEKFADKVFETSYFSGTAYAFRREPMIAAGLYPEILYMHYEEVELAIRLLDQGGRIFYSPFLEALHHAAPTSRRSRIDSFYKPRNQILLAYRCFPFAKAVGYVTPRVVLNACKALVGLERSRDFLRALDSAKDIFFAKPSVREPVAVATLKRIRHLKKA